MASRGRTGVDRPMLDRARRTRDEIIDILAPPGLTLLQELVRPPQCAIRIVQGPRISPVARDETEIPLGERYYRGLGRFLRNRGLSGKRFQARYKTRDVEYRIPEAKRVHIDE